MNYTKAANSKGKDKIGNLRIRKQRTQQDYFNTWI